MRLPFEIVRSASPRELRCVLLMFLYSFSASGAYVVGRAVADALFLARIGPRWLPWMYLVSACVLGLLSAVFANIAARYRLKRLILFTLLILAVSTIVLCQLVQHFDHALILLAGIYLQAEIRGSLNTVQYGILMNELFAGSSNHQEIFGLVGAAATLAGITLGAIVGFEVYLLGTVHLMYVVAGLELLAGIPIFLLPRVESAKAHDPEADSDSPSSTDFSEVFTPAAFTKGLATAAGLPYVRGIAVLVAMTVAAGTLVEFQWKSSAADTFATNEDQMTSYFGLFHAAVFSVTGLIQLFVTGKLLTGLGARTSLLAFPAALLASTLGVLFASFDRVLLAAITLAKGCDVIKRSINDPAVLILYAPLGNGPRRQAITFVSGIVKPSAEAITALLIIALSSIVAARAISYVVLALLCVWVLAVLRHRTNAKTLETHDAKGNGRGSA